ncbi:MAG: pre-mRNA-splicing factor [Candidatus Dehalobacter alkaniphilus]
MPMTERTIQKGTISSIEGEVDRNGDRTKARVLPSTSGGSVTRPLTIPWWLRGQIGNLAPGVEVAFALFEDSTGIILTRMDGEWNGSIPGDVTIDGDLKVNDMETNTVESYNSHIHGGVQAGTSDTSEPL